MKQYLVTNDFDMEYVARKVKEFMFSADCLVMRTSSISKNGPYDDSGIARGKSNPYLNVVGKNNKRNFVKVLSGKGDDATDNADPVTENHDESVPEYIKTIASMVIRSGEVVARIGMGDTVWMDENDCIIQHVNHNEHANPELRKFVMIHICDPEELKKVM